MKKLMNPFAGMIFFGMLLVSVSANAQEKKFNSGLIFGLNTSQITGDNLGGYDKFGITAGAFVSRKFGDRFSMALEMTYLPKGSRKNLNPKDSVQTFYLLKLHYVEVPLMLQYLVTSKLQVEMGPSMGVYLGYYEEDLNGVLSGPYASRQAFKPLELSANVGVSWFINDKWVFNVRNSNSIFPVRDHDQGTKYRLNRGQYSSCIMGRFIYRF